MTTLPGRQNLQQPICKVYPAHLSESYLAIRYVMSHRKMGPEGGLQDGARVKGMEERSRNSSAYLYGRKEKKRGEEEGKS